MSEGMCYVLKNESYHKGPGWLWDRDIASASLYPVPVAQQIAEIYRGQVVDALQHIQELVREHNEAVERLHGLAVEIRTGARTYMRVPDQVVNFYDLNDEIRGMPPSALRTFLIHELEVHERELSTSVQGEGSSRAHS